MYNNIIAVNIGKSIASRESVKEAAHGFWRPIGRATSSRELAHAEFVVAVKVNTVAGVFRVVNVYQDPNTLRYEWELHEAPALRSLAGHKIPEEGPYWKAGDRAGWKVFDPEVFNETLNEAKDDVVPVGPHKILLLADGSLEIEMAPGYELHIFSKVSTSSSRDRIAAVIQRLGESEACTTYGAIAEMLGLKGQQVVARSIAKNAELSAADAARVIPSTFKDLTSWTIPRIEEEWNPQSDDPRSRAELLINQGIANSTAEGAAEVLDHQVITDGATLRRYLNV